MKNSNVITLTDEQVLGDKKVILTAQTEQYEYVDGKKTDKISGCRFTVVSPYRNFQSFNVKVENGKLLDLTEEQIDMACASMNLIWVKFLNFTAKPYASPNGRGIAYSCSASGIEIVNNVDIFGGDV